MWTRQLLMAAIGLSAGGAIAAGLFAFITSLGVVSDFADRTHTGSSVRFYEDCLAAGGIVGNVFSIYEPRVLHSGVLLGVFGLLSGIFVGCWIMALAEILNVFPIFMRRAKILKGIPYLIASMALGKDIGALVYFWNGW